MYPGAHAASTPDKPAVVIAGGPDDGAVTTYAELDDRSARIATALTAHGLTVGDVVALVSDNRPEVFEVYWACLRSGLYVTAVNHHLTPREAAYIVRDSGARVVIASAALGDLAGALAADTPGVEHRVAFGGDLPGHTSYDALLATELPDAPVVGPRGGDMLYSSGTTGHPKGVKPPLLGVAVDQPGDPITGLLAAGFGVGAETRYLSVAPIYHAAPLRWCGAVHAMGGTVVMTHRFDAEQTLAAIQDHAITHVQVVPTMFVRMLQLPAEVRVAYDTSSLAVAVHAAAPCPPEVKDAMIAWWGPKLVEYYSSTEANGFTVITSPEWQTKRGSVGRSLLGIVHICGEDGTELETGQVGDVWFEREAAPFDYHHDADKTAASRHPDHPTWTTIGDVGYVDADGYLFLTDRKSFTIISGGVNIYPQEIENLLTLHPAIHDVAVVGLPDPVMGQAVTAFVQAASGVVADDALGEELVATVRAELASYKVPKRVVFVDELPRTATGKLVKRRLLDQTESEAVR